MNYGLTGSASCSALPASPDCTGRIQLPAAAHWYLGPGDRLRGVLSPRQRQHRAAGREPTESRRRRDSSTPEWWGLLQRNSFSVAGATCMPQPSLQCTCPEHARMVGSAGMCLRWASIRMGMSMGARLRMHVEASPSDLHAQLHVSLDMGAPVHAVASFIDAPELCTGARGSVDARLHMGAPALCMASAVDQIPWAKESGFYSGFAVPSVN